MASKTSTTVAFLRIQKVVILNGRKISPRNQELINATYVQTGRVQTNGTAQHSTVSIENTTIIEIAEFYICCNDKDENEDEGI